MKKTNKSTDMTSFHGDVFTTSLNELKEKIGKPDAQNIDNKVQFEWELQTKCGQVFTIYDWREPRTIFGDTVIDWHIGGHTRISTILARKELIKLFQT